jgi:uncharacterized RmlC-like cupin family protein
MEPLFLYSNGNYEINVRRKRMAVVLRKNDAQRNPDTGLESGICAATIPNLSPPFTLAHNIMPPGYRSSTHSHTKVCRGTYVAKGRIRFFFGIGDNQQVIDTEEGDYVYTPIGEIHSQLNLSNTETAEYTSTYIGESDRNELGTIFMKTNQQ